MRHYERRLPHWDVVDQPVFVTFRLHSSLPAHRVFPPASLTGSGKALVAMDRLLDEGASGPLYLRVPEIAEMVVSALLDGGAEVLSVPVARFRRDAQSRSRPGYSQGTGYSMVGAAERVHRVSGQ